MMRSWHVFWQVSFHDVANWTCECVCIYIYTHYILSYIIIQHLDFPPKGSQTEVAEYPTLRCSDFKCKLTSESRWERTVSFILVWVITLIQSAVFLFAMNLPTGMPTPQDLPLNILFLKPQMDCQWRMGGLGRTSKSPGEIHGLGICQKDSTWLFIVLILMLRHRWIDHRMKWYILPKMVEFIEWPLQAALWRHDPFFRAVDTGHPGTIFYYHRHRKFWKFI